VIRHSNPNGGYFFALYGHIRASVSVGDVVSRGDTIGTICGTTAAPYGHLHFGINTQQASYRGYGDIPGFVDPVHFLANLTGTPTPTELPGTATTIGNGTYKITSVGSPSRVLGVSTWGTPEHNNNVTIFDDINNVPTQTWRLERYGDAYLIHTTVSPLVLNAFRDGAAIAGTNVNVRNRVAGANTQLWVLRDVGNGQFVIASRTNENLVITAAGTENSARTSTQPFTGSNLQKWTFTNLSAPQPPDPTPEPPPIPTPPEQIPPHSGINVRLNGNYLRFDVPPMIINNRTMVPMRVIFEALGMTVHWNNNTRTATGTLGNLIVELPIDSSTAFINGEAISLDVQATIHNDRTLVPVRFIAEATGATVDWNQATQTVIITK